MTDDQHDRPPAHVAARQARLRAALRENLKRRKFQSRGRAEPGAPDSGADAAADTYPGQTDSDDLA